MTAIQKNRSNRRAAPRWTIASTEAGSATALAYSAMNRTDGRGNSRENHTPGAARPSIASEIVRNAK
jgi:hypothetical protein